MIAHIFQLERHKNIENYAFKLIKVLYENLSNEEFIDHSFYFSYFENEDLKDSIVQRLDEIYFPMHKIKYFKDHYMMMKSIKDSNNNNNIFHQLSSTKVFNFLFFNKKLNKNVSWVMWGGDAYRGFVSRSFRFKIYDYIVRKRVIKNLKNITGMKGDFELLKMRYRTQAQHFTSISPMPSKVFPPSEYKSANTETIKVLVAHSANKINNHKKIFEYLLPYKEENIELITPLSYGELSNVAMVERTGYKLFNKKFKPLRTFMKPEEFSDLLSEIDIAVFAIERQAAFGIMGTLLSLGKKIYYKKGIVPFEYYEENNIKIFDTNKLGKTPFSDFINMNEEDRINNIKQINRIYSDENIINMWRAVFAS